MTQDWTHTEVEAIVSDYFAMLGQDLRGEAYSKSAHRAALKSALRGRSDGSIEWKHQNISAVLLDLGFPYIPGYKPRRNYQRLLWETVAARLAVDRALVTTVHEQIEQPAPAPGAVMIPSTFDDPPRPVVGGGARTGEPRPSPFVPRPGAPVDYLAREARNRSLGAAGERLVLEFEVGRLRRLGAQRLAARVEHVAATQGDGIGFDIRSFELDGRDRLIEVKTTAFGKETPFFVTRNELACSEASADRYHLYRVFTFRRDPRLFTLAGPLNKVCALEPTQYLGRVA